MLISFSLKRLFAVILAFFYLTIATGIMVNLHYCMGELASVDYGHAKQENCGKCGMPDNGNACCHTDSKLIKLQDDHQLSTVVFAFTQPALEPVATLWHAVAVAEDHSSLVQSAIHAPPDIYSNHVYLVNCIFRV